MRSFHLPSDSFRALFLLVTAALLIGANACEKAKTPEAAVQTVQMGTAEEIQPDTAQRFSTTILPNMQVDLAFKSPGIVQEIYQVHGADGRVRDVEPGDRVVQGTQLASVRSIDYQQRLEQTEAGVQQAQAQWDEARVAFAKAELDYNRAQNLYASSSLTKPDFDRAKASYESTRAQVQAAQAASEGVRSQADQAKLSLGDTAIRAPFTGFVTARNIAKGGLVGSSPAAMSMIDTHVVKAQFAVPDTSLSQVRLGQRLTIELDSQKRPRTGTVIAISPQADPKSRVFSVDVSIGNADGAIRPGMIGSVTLAQPRHVTSRLAIPASAIVRAPDGGFGVYRVENREGKTYALTQSIEIGSTYGNAIEVTKGLSKGQRIVILGGELLRSGQEIRVLPYF